MSKFDHDKGAAKTISMLKFKRVKPKFPDTSSNLVNTAPIIRARLIQGFFYASFVVSITKRLV